MSLFLLLLAIAKSVKEEDRVSFCSIVGLLENLWQKRAKAWREKQSKKAPSNKKKGQFLNCNESRSLSAMRVEV